MKIKCLVCETENEQSSIWCKGCRATLPYYEKMQNYYDCKGSAPTVPKRVGPFKIGVKKMAKPTKEWLNHAENRVRLQFRILHIYAWMLEKKIIKIEDYVIWGGAPLQQCSAGKGNQAAHKILASLMFSSDGKNWKYLYDANPSKSICKEEIWAQVKVVLGAMHAAVSILDKKYNEVDNFVEKEIRAMVLRYIDEIRGVFVAKEYNKKTWPRLWMAFRSDYAKLCYKLVADKLSKDLNVDKSYKQILKKYGEVAEGLKYEKLVTVKKVFKKIVNTSEEGSWH